MAHRRMYDYLSESGELRQAEPPCSCLVVLGEARKGGLPTGHGGMETMVYTNNHVFRIQKQKGNSVSLGAFWFSSRIWQRYLITLSAPANMLGEMVRPICFAAFKLITNSNFFGCSTGSSAGLAPFRILST